MKKLLILAILVSSVCFNLDVCLAKEFTQKNRVFTISIPDDWSVEEVEGDFDKALIYRIGKNEKTKEVSVISIQPKIRINLERGITKGISVPPGVKEKDLLDYYFQRAIDVFKAEPGSRNSIISLKKISLNGLPAFRIDFTSNFRPQGGALIYGSFFGCVTKNYIYDIILSDSSQDGIPKLEKALDTIKLKR